MASHHQQPNACELKNKVAVRVGAGLFVLALFSTSAAPASAQHEPQAKPAGEHQTQPEGEHAAEGEHGSALSALLWPTVNFAILVGGLWWFFKEPFANYLRDRHTTIRRDLVEAASMKAAAAAQIDELDRKLKALPAEIEALRTRGAEEIASEERRIAAQAAAERERLLEQTRREIELQVRLAKRELVEHAADLAVQVADDRLRRQMTPEDQERLVDRYLGQVKRSRPGTTH